MFFLRKSSRARKSRRLKLANRLAYYPTLRLLLFHRWSRVMGGVFLLFMVAFALYLPKVWRTSPPGFTPVIQVSGLDLTQAWSLKKTARRADAEGQTEAAVQAWLTAVANNPADPELVRGFLGSLERDENRPNHLAWAIGQSFWLLRLTRTNQADLVLTTRLLERFQLYDLVREWLEAPGALERPALEAAYLRALFHTGRPAAFAARWPTAGDAVKQDPALRLYWAAYQAAWGPAASAPAGRQELEQAVSEPAQKNLACRLLLAVSAQRGDAPAYERWLRQLQEERADAILDQVGYWNLLAAGGRKAEAVKLAEVYPFPPKTAPEALGLAQGYVKLGLREPARKVLQRYAPEFAYIEALWVFYGQLLLEDQLWDEVQNLALRLRQLDGLQDSLSGFSYFLEGRALLGLNRIQAADEAFNQIPHQPLRNQALALAVAAQLLQLNRPLPAWQLLAKYESHFLKDPDYWNLMFAAAYAVKDSDLLLKAATTAKDLKPSDPALINNYAAALLIQRSQPDTAIKWTVQLLAGQPNSLAARVNHSLALAMNQRPLEAKTILDTIASGQLSGPEATAYYLARFEVALQLRDWDQARQASDRINPVHLFPGQIRWLEEARRHVPAPKP